MATVYCAAVQGITPPCNPLMALMHKLAPTAFTKLARKHIRKTSTMSSSLSNTAIHEERGKRYVSCTQEAVYVPA